MKKIFLILILILLINSCKKVNNLGSFKQRNSTNLETIEINNLQYSKYHNFDNDIKEIIHVKLENNKSFVGSFDKIIKKGDSIFIADYKFSKAIFCFNIKGKFLFKISHLGESSQEYMAISDFFVDIKNNSIGVLDPSKNNIKMYSMQNYLYIKTLDFLGNKTIATRIAYNNENFFVTRNNECDFTDFNCYNFSVFKDGHLLYEDLPVHQSLKNNSYIKQRYFSVNQDVVYFNPIYNDTIYSYENGNFNSKYFIDFGKHKLPNNIKYSKENDLDNIIFKHCMKKDLTWGIEFFAHTDNMLYTMFNIANKSYSVFYNPKTKKGVKFFGFQSTKYHLSSVQYASDNYFICVTSLETLLDFKNFYLKADDDFKIKNKRLYEEIKDLNQNDNDLLTLFKLKDFE